MKSYKFSFHYEKDPFSNDIKLKKFDQDISTKTFTLTFYPLWILFYLNQKNQVQCTEMTTSQGQAIYGIRDYCLMNAHVVGE